MQDGAVQGSGSAARSGPGEQGAPRIVVVGAGFAGMEVAKALQGAPARVTLIDRHNYTLFQPLLHQVATAALSPADVQPVQQCANRRCDIEILLDELVAVEIERSCLRMACGRRAKYDLLVLATGSPANFVECYDLMTIGSGAR